jgi:hypothetical protein
MCLGWISILPGKTGWVLRQVLVGSSFDLSVVAAWAEPPQAVP